MKKLNAIVSVSCVTAIAFYGLSAISQENEFTSVRKYAKPKPVVETTSALSETTVEGGKTEDVGNEPALVADLAETGALTGTGTPADVVPPTIEFLDYEDGQIVTAASVDVRAEVTDDVSPASKIRVEWTGKYELKIGFNPIVVSAFDEAGNATHEYVILERSE